MKKINTIVKSDTPPVTGDEALWVDTSKGDNSIKLKVKGEGGKYTQVFTAEGMDISDLEDKIQENKYSINKINKVLAAKEDVANKVTSIGADANNTTFPTTRAVLNSIAEVKNKEVTPEMLSESTKQYINASGGGTITNLADDEDLTSVGNVLKLANKDYSPTSYSGMGRVYLRKNMVDGKNILTQEMMTKENTIYIIQYDYDLNGATINVPANCTLDFQGGSLGNGVLNGNDTRLAHNYHTNIFNNTDIGGSWKCLEANTRMFAQDINANDLFLNLSLLSRCVQIYPDKNYRVEKKSQILKIDKLYGVGNIKPTIEFDASVNNGNNENGFIFDSPNLHIENIKFTENFVEGSANNGTLGSSMNQKNSSGGEYVYATIVNCEFSGSFSSSCFSSSVTTNLFVSNTKVVDALITDHAFYTSINTRSFIISKCSFKNISRTNGLLKVRESPYLEDIKVLDSTFYNINSYVMFVNIVADDVYRNTNINFNNVYLNKDIDFVSNGTFCYLSCASDGAKINNVVISQSTIYGGETKDDGARVDRPLIYAAASYSVRCNNIEIINSDVRYYSIYNKAENTIFVNSNLILTGVFELNNCSISNCKLLNDEASTTASLFKNPSNISIKNSLLTGIWTYLFQFNKVNSEYEKLMIELDGVTINRLKRNVFSFTVYDSPNPIYYKEANCSINRNSGYNLVTGNDASIIANPTYNTTAKRPIGLSKNESGYQFFDTTLNKPIWWTGSAWVDATGQEV